jgi:hypothetical protein
MKLATATLSMAALLAAATPVFAEAMSSSSYWENMRGETRRSEPATHGRPYALTGETRHAGEGDFHVCTRWTRAGREYGPVFKRN